MPLALATPAATAALWGAIAGGGSQVAGAVINSKSNNKSAKLQTDAANHAADVQAKANADALKVAQEQQNYDRFETQAAQQARAPYVDLANRSLASISGRLGISAPNFSATSMPVSRPQSATSQTAGVSPAASPSLSSVGSLASLYQPPVPASAQMNRDQLTASQTPTSGMRGVKVIAPTGEVAIIAPGDVARAVAEGAKVA